MIQYIADEAHFKEVIARVLCPRVHFKIIIFDHSLAYVGSANLTGAGLGMKSARTRNFEAGIPHGRACPRGSRRQPI